MSGRLSFQTQLASIMEVLANAAVAEICKLVEDDYAVVSLQMSQCQRENKALKRKLHLLEIKMARGTAERRLRESAAGSGRPRVLLSGAERPREAADTSRAPGACFSSRDTCTDGTFGGQMDVVLWSDQAAAGDAELIHTKQEQTKSPDVQLVEVDEAQLKVEKVEADMSRVTELEDDLEEVLIKDDGLVEPLPRGSGPRLALQHQDHQTTSSRTQTSTTTPTPSLGGRRRRSGSRGVEKREEEEEDVVLVKVEQVRAEPGSLEQARAEPQSDSSLSIQEGLVESSTDDFRATLSYDDVTQSSTNQLPDHQDSGRSLPESAETTPVVSRDPASMAGVRLRVPDMIPDSERTRIRPRTRTSSGSEFSLFDLESLFTRWAPDPEPTAAPGGPSCSFTNHNSAQTQQDHVIVLENEAQYVVRAPQEATGSLSGVPQTGSHAGPSVPLPLRIQAPPPQPHWSRSSSLMRSRSSAPTTAPSSLSHSSKAASGGPGEQRRKNYMCRTCGKAFSGVSNLEAHRRVHTGEKPFRCATCGKHFSEAGNLKKHQRVHTGEKPFSCERCGKKFAWICNLRTHQQSSTGCGGGGA